LVEVVVSTLLVGVLLVASTKTVGAVFRTRRVNAGLTEREVLAWQLMAKILTARYEDPEETVVPIGDPANPLGRESGEGNAPYGSFDDVDDYLGWSRNPPENGDGFALGGYDGYTRSVDIQRVQPDTLQVSAANETGAKLILVTVTPPVGDPVVLKALRSRFGAVEQPPMVDTTFVTFMEGKLQTGSSPAVYNSAKNMVNHASDQ
jgi:hypothetical protein